MFTLTEVFLLVVVGIISAVFYFNTKNKNLPPGPPQLPFFGNLFQLLHYPYLKHYKWARKYGRLHTFSIGRDTVVAINDVRLAKEMLSDYVFTDKPPLEVFKLFTGGDYGILFTKGAPWEEQRRFALRKLRDFGFGKSSMEGIIMNEVNEVIEYFKGQQGKQLLISDKFGVAVVNSLWTILTGKRMRQDDPKIRKLTKTFDEILTTIANSGLYFSYAIRHVRPDKFRIVKDAADRVMSFAREVVAEHYETFEEGTSRDFIDEYIAEIKKTTDPKSSFYGDVGRKNLEGVVSEFVQGGSITTSNSIIWSICYLTQFPDKQRKLQEELDSVLGERSVTVLDKSLLPYAQAVIQETLRYSSLSSGGLAHCAAADRKVEGYTIPKGTWILTNMYYMHHNPDIWGDPENFRPERHLSSEAKFVKSEFIIPFQIGKRQCLGESLARDSLFLYITTIFQQFDISKVEKEMPQAENSFFRVPQQYNFVFKSRHQ